MIGDRVVVNEMLFFAGDDLFEKPMIGLTNMCEKISGLLESQRDSLTWHDGAVTDNEIWVKAGGDHGQGSLKFSLATVNTKNQNSEDNIVLIGKACIKIQRKIWKYFFE